MALLPQPHGWAGGGGSLHLHDASAGEPGYNTLFEFGVGVNEAHGRHEYAFIGFYLGVLTVGGRYRNLPAGEGLVEASLGQSGSGGAVISEQESPDWKVFDRTVLANYLEGDPDGSSGFGIRFSSTSAVGEIELQRYGMFVISTPNLANA